MLLLAAFGLTILCALGSFGATVFQTATSASAGCSLVAVEGSFNGDDQAALDRINEIRLEACREGVRDPRNGSRFLTEADYVPLKWSSSLEYIARVRAAESSLVVSHTRPNGKDCFSVQAPDGKESYSENLAWNWENTIVSGIEQWYKEKSDWVNKTPNAKVGHYASMINPGYRYVGLASFTNERGVYINTVSCEYDGIFDHDTHMADPVPKSRVIIEIRTDALSDPLIIEKEKVVQKGYFPDKGDQIIYGLGIRATLEERYQSYVYDIGGTSWTISDPSVAEVDQSGLVKIKEVGTAVLSAVSDSGISASRTIRPEHFFRNSMVTLAETCTKDGIKTYTCYNCGETKTEAIPATGHTVADDKAVEATCTDEGKTAGTYCIRCGAVIKAQKSIPALGHNWGEWTITRAATYYTEGEEMRLCKNNAFHAQWRTIAKLAKKAEPAETSSSEYPLTPGTKVPENKEAEVISAAAQEKAILSKKSDADPAGSTYGLLQARMKKVTKNSITLKWKKINGAKYTIYGNKCGKKNKYKKLKTVSGTSFTQKKLKKGTYYKYLIVAVKDGKAIATSKTIHVATTGGKVGNTKTVKPKKKAFSVKIGKTAKIKVTTTPVSKKLKVKSHRKIAYESSNSNIATVSAKGVVTGIRAGTCYVYAYAQNGIMAKITVKVS